MDADDKPTPGLHEHDWQSAGKKWDVCSVDGCARVRLTVRAKWIDIDKPRHEHEHEQEKAIEIEFDGQEIY